MSFTNKKLLIVAYRFPLIACLLLIHIQLFPQTKDSIPPGVKAVPHLVFDSPPENLGPNINSAYSEVLPVIAPDGKRIYFTRKDHPQNFDASFAPNDDIWYSTL